MPIPFRVPTGDNSSHHIPLLLPDKAFVSGTRGHGAIPTFVFSDAGLEKRLDVGSTPEAPLPRPAASRSLLSFHTDRINLSPKEKKQENQYFSHQKNIFRNTGTAKRGKFSTASCLNIPGWNERVPSHLHLISAL